MDIEQSLSCLKEITLPQGLSDKVFSRIHKAQKRRALIDSIVFGSLSAGSLCGVVFACVSFVQMMSQTGFSQYVSLLFSDGASLLASWKEFSLLLAESIPLMSVIIVLITIGIFAWSVSKMVEKRKTMYAFNY